MDETVLKDESLVINTDNENIGDEKSKLTNDKTKSENTDKKNILESNILEIEKGNLVNDNLNNENKNEEESCKHEKQNIDLNDCKGKKDENKKDINKTILDGVNAEKSTLNIKVSNVDEIKETKCVGGDTTNVPESVTNEQSDKDENKEAMCVEGDTTNVPESVTNEQSDKDENKEAMCVQVDTTNVPESVTNKQSGKDENEEAMCVEGDTTNVPESVTNKQSDKDKIEEAMCVEVDTTNVTESVTNEQSGNNCKENMEVIVLDKPVDTMKMSESETNEQLKNSSVNGDSIEEKKKNVIDAFIEKLLMKTENNEIVEEELQECFRSERLGMEIPEIEKKILAEKVFLGNGIKKHVFSVFIKDRKWLYMCHVCGIDTLKHFSDFLSHHDGKKHKNNVGKAIRFKERFAVTISEGICLKTGLGAKVFFDPEINYCSKSLIGLEYLVMYVQKQGVNTSTRFYCLLCNLDTDDKAHIIKHIQSSEHCSTYLAKFFPDVHKLRKRNDKKYQRQLPHIIESIQFLYGRLPPIEVQRVGPFDLWKSALVQMVTNGKHFWQNPKYTFVDCLDLSHLKNEGKGSCKTKLKKLKKRHEKIFQAKEFREISKIEQLTFESYIGTPKSRPNVSSRSIGGVKTFLPQQRSRDRFTPKLTFFPQEQARVQFTPGFRSGEKRKLSYEETRMPKRINKSFKHYEDFQERLGFRNKISMRGESFSNSGGFPGKNRHQPFSDDRSGFQNFVITMPEDGISRNNWLYETRRNEADSRNSYPPIYQRNERPIFHSNQEFKDPPNLRQFNETDYRNSYAPNYQRNERPVFQSNQEIKNPPNLTKFNETDYRNSYAPNYQRNERPGFQSNQENKNPPNQKTLNEGNFRNSYSPTHQRNERPVFQSNQEIKDPNRGQPKRNLDSSEPVPENKDLIAVLRQLSVLEEYLGYLGPKVISLLAETVKAEKFNEGSGNRMLSDLKNCVLLETVKEKLIGLLESSVINPKFVGVTKIIVQKINSLISAVNKSTSSSEWSFPSGNVVQPSDNNTLTSSNFDSFNLRPSQFNQRSSGYNNASAKFPGLMQPPSFSNERFNIFFAGNSNFTPG